MSAPSDYFETITVQDDRINSITDKIQYAVIKGASSNNMIQNQATSKSTSSIVFNQPIPSETTIVDRRIMLKTTMVFKTARASVSTQLRYPSTFNFAPFPLHQMTQTISLTLNNTSVSCQIRDVLPGMLRVMDVEDLYQFNSGCPTAFDRYGKYQDEVVGWDADSATLAAADLVTLAQSKNYSNFQGFGGLRENFIPRGSFAVDGFFTDEACSTPLDPDANTTTNSMVGSSSGTNSVFIKITTYEPVLISPLVFGKKSGQSGMYGLQNIIIQYTLSPDASRAFRSTCDLTGVSLVAITDATIELNMLSCQPSTLLSARNVLSHYQIDRLISTYADASTQLASALPLASNTFTLSVIPDYIMIYVRPPTSSLSFYKPDSFAEIQRVNIQFANVSGILSTATQQNLYAMSLENGYNGAFLEWANKAWGSGNSLRGLKKLITSGSVLVLRFGKDISLPEYACAGCVGNWSLKIDVSAKQLHDNQFKNESWATSDSTDRTAGSNLQCELNILTVTSGVMVLERGQSSIHLGLLTRQDAIDAANSDAIGFQGSQRLVGKGFFDGIGSIFGKVKDFASNALGVAKQVSPLLKMGANALGKPEISNALSSVGLGKTGAGHYSGNNLSHRIA